MNPSYKLAELAHKVDTTDFGMVEILDILEPYADLKAAEEAMIAIYAAREALKAAYHVINKAAGIIDLHVTEIRDDL